MRDARTPRAQTTVRRELRTRLKQPEQPEQQQRVDQRKDDEIGKRNGWETAQPAINRFAHGTSSLSRSPSLRFESRLSFGWERERERGSAWERRWRGAT